MNSNSDKCKKDISLAAPPLAGKHINQLFANKWNQVPVGFPTNNQIVCHWRKNERQLFKNAPVAAFFNLLTFYCYIF
jgi:hypothetical protein